MNAEGSRDPERNWHAFPIPKGLREREALEFFERHKKPAAMKLCKYKYRPETGVFLALDESCR